MARATNRHIEFMCIFSLGGHTDENGCQQYWQDHLETQKTHLLLMLGTLGLTTTFWVTTPSGWGLPRWCYCKEPACQCRRRERHRFNPWVRKIPWSRKRQPAPVFMPG